jgi:response regulator RpfG family c-di-GMP phosphodiesterase
MNPELPAALAPQTPEPDDLCSPAALPHTFRILIVDDDDANRSMCRRLLEGSGYICGEAADGVQGLARTLAEPYDLVLLDIQMPAMSGIEMLRRLREQPPSGHLKVIMLSGGVTQDEMSELLAAGADDFLAKPMSLIQMQARIRAALRLKVAQERSDLLTRRLLAVNQELEVNLTARDSDLIQARNALVLALAELVAKRDVETGAHLTRVQSYCRYLGERAAAVPNFAGQVDEVFVHLVECCAPLHDIGKAAIPDHVLLKPGKLTAEERLIMQKHTTIGAEVLHKVARRHGFAQAFLQMATDIVRHHHERFDGTGYPDGLAGDVIPVAARIMAIADVYDALRSPRVYKPALAHDVVVKMMLEQSPGQFDPALLHLFQDGACEFERIYREATE